jgi:peptidoglycan/xylan/chitin deacetylase (PgdA/CDA1 family)
MKNIIIVYHGIGNKDKFMQVEICEFKKQVNHIITSNFKVCFLEEVLVNKKGKNICIMFDDGLESSKLAIEWLEKKKIKYNLAIVENFINQQGYLTLEYIKSLKYARIYFHTKNHKKLNCLDLEKLKEEITCNSDVFRKGIIVYPQGLYDYSIFEILKEHEYKYGLTVNPYHMSKKNKNYEIPRICINGFLKFWKFKLFLSKTGNIYLHLAVLKRKMLKQNMLK